MARFFAMRVYVGVRAHGEYENLSAHEAIVTTDEWNAANARKRTGVRAERDALAPRRYRSLR